MKKFTKGCLITALVLFIIGIALCGVCGLLGGFRQLEELGGIGGIPFRYGRNAAGGWEFGFFDAEESEGDDPEELEDIENIRKSVDDTAEKRLAEIEGDKEQLALAADTFGILEIDVEACNVIIRESSDEHVWFLVDGHANRPYYTIENEHGMGKLCIENEVEHRFWHWRNGPNDTVYLWLPKGCALEECDIDVGAGYMKSISLHADRARISVGAGLLEMEDFVGNDIILSADAGELLAGHITSETAVLQVGAGHLGIEELSANREADIDIGMGQVEIAGTITGDLDLECDMGEAVLRLTGSENDHSYDVECGMGEIRVGSYSHSGVASQKSWNSGKDSEFDIDCNMGTVTVTFED